MRSLIDLVAGAWKHQPEDIGNISTAAADLIAQAFEGIAPGTLRDYHAHLVGLGAGGTGAQVHPSLLSWKHPIHRIKGLVYMSGGGIDDESRADQQYVDRLLSMIQSGDGCNTMGAMGLLAFDWHYTPAGDVNVDKSEFYTPNAWVLDLANRHPDAFFPIVSVHPYREDALDEIDRCAAQGAKIMKWLPNGQGMKGDEARLEAYYQRLKDHGMALLTHVGEEQAVEAEEDQALGNPLLFRKPLDMGVKVIMAHAASLGTNADIEGDGRQLDNVDLMLRLFDDPNYDDLLFADISATLQFNRLPGPMLKLLERPDLHHRLINGTDYPLPAINVVVRIRDLVRHGLIDAQERKALAEIYHYNALLFDFVVKRRIRHPRTGQRFPVSLFVEHPSLPVR